VRFYEVRPQRNNRPVGSDLLAHPANQIWLDILPLRVIEISKLKGRVPFAEQDRELAFERVIWVPSGSRRGFDRRQALRSADDPELYEIRFICGESCMLGWKFSEGI